MQRVSIRTLILVIELFAAVVSFQYLAALKSAQVGVHWRAGDSVPVAPAPCAVSDCNRAG